MMGKIDAETAFSVVTQLVVQARLVDFTEFFADIKPKAGTLIVGCEEWIKYLLHLLGRYAAAIVNNRKI